MNLSPERLSGLAADTGFRSESLEKVSPGGTARRHRPAPAALARVGAQRRNRAEPLFRPSTATVR